MRRYRSTRFSHFLERISAVLGAERVPHDADRHSLVTSEKAASNDSIVRAVQLEQEGLARLEGDKRSSGARLPEVDLINTIELAQRFEPVLVSDSHDGSRRVD